MSTAMASMRVNELTAIVGERHVVEGPDTLQDFAIDAKIPAVSVSPGSVEEVAAVLRYAYEHDLTVVPAGGFVHQEIGNRPERVDLLLRMDRLTGVEHYDPGDLTIGVGAGVTILDLQNLLQQHAQIFPLDIPHTDRVTIGGAMSVAAHGPHKHFYGGLRDFCLGVRFVTADGKAAKGGGRVVKNVAGFDLMKLMVGSYGSLGVITSASFKVFPRPRNTRTFVCEFNKLTDANEFRDWLINSPFTPICLELLSPKALDSYAWTLAIRGAGSDRVLGRYKKEIGSALSREIEGKDEQLFWHRIENLGAEAPVLMNVSAPPQDGGAALASIERIAHENKVELIGWGRIGIGSLLIALTSGMAENYAATITALRNTLPPDASAVLTRCPVPLKGEIDVWGKTPTDLASMKAVKSALNPKGNLNRGRFLL